MIRKKDGFRGEYQVVLPPMLIEMQEHDPLTSSLIITDIGYYPKAEHHFRIREQAIDQYVLIYCVDGSGFYVIDGKQYEVKKNQYFILPAGKPHIYGAAEAHHWTIYWIHFKGSHAPIYAEGAITPQDINMTLHSRISERIRLFEEMLNILHEVDGLEDLRYASSLLHYFLASMRYLNPYRKARYRENPSINKTKQATTYNALDIVEQAIHYMRENIEHHITLNDVLHFVGYSQSHFSTVFKKKTGLSPLAYFNRLKIEHSCKLLKDTDMKINQICYKVGIEDALYFSRLFSRHVGLSPREFRQKETNIFQ